MAPQSELGSTSSALVVLSEGLTLVALAALPAVFNLSTERIFEEEKALLLCVTALAALPGVLISWWELGRPLIRQPIVLTFIGLILVFAGTSLLAVTPREAFEGAYIRRHGVVSWLSLATLFGAMCAAARSPAGRQRLLLAVVAGSIWPSVYALIQWVGIDPVQWTDTTPGRVGSTFGNPLLLGGYLAAVIPLTLMEVRRHRAYTGVAGLQLAALAASGSRGPALALAAGLAVVGVALTWSRFSRRAIVAAAATSTLLVVAVATMPALRPPVVDRFFQTGSGRVRVLVWQGVAELTRESGWRLWLGHGLESLPRLFPPHYSPEIGQIEGTESMPDRAHNELLDTLVTAGIPAVVLQLSFFGVVLAGAHRIRNGWLRAGLMAAAAAHMFEIQLGIATIVSRLIFISVAAVIVGVRAEAHVRALDPSGQIAPATGGSRQWVFLAALVGALSPLLSGVTSRSQDFVTSGTAETLIDQIAFMSLSTPILYAAVFLVALAVARSIVPFGPAVSQLVPQSAVITVVAVLAIPTAVTPSRADVFSKVARGFEAKGQWAEAALAYREAARRQPSRSYYLTGLSRALIQQGISLEGSERQARFRAAREALERAATLEPGSADHVRNLASLNRIEARSREADARDDLLVEADRLYALAVERSPRMPSLWIEWANVDAERRRFSQSIEKLNRAVALDQNRSDVWLLRGHVLALQQDPVRALAAYDRTLQMKPEDVGATRGRAIALASLRRWDEAIAALDRVLELAPGDPVSVRLRQQLAAESSTPRGTTSAIQ